MSCSRSSFWFWKSSWHYTKQPKADIHPSLELQLFCFFLQAEKHLWLNSHSWKDGPRSLNAETGLCFVGHALPLLKAAWVVSIDVFCEPSPSGSDKGERMEAENKCMNPAPIYLICDSVPSQSSLAILAN